MPQGHVCCGRPLYDYGFLDLAQRYLHSALDVVREHVREGTPVVGMEPSCLAVFKDELTKMLPHDDDAARLARNAYHFAEFFQTFGIEPPKLEGRALQWTHCHHRATGGSDPEQHLLEQMGLQVQSLTGGCCGLAGSWGFESGKYEISMDCGEQALLPAVRDADQQTVVVADGFSCTTQIEDAGTGRRALHVAELMKLAREHGRYALAETQPPEQLLRAHRPSPGLLRRSVRTALPLAAAAAPAAALLARRRLPGRVVPGSAVVAR
jgi:Fe-S oxidoreductase